MTPPDASAPEPAPGSSVPDPQALRAWVDGRQAAMLDDLGSYVRLESPSDDKPALDRTLSWLRAWLDRHLGPPDAERCVDGGPYGDIVVRDYAGDATPGIPPVLLLCHYDTVWPLGTLDELPFTVSEDRVTGPGVFDMKAGLVQAVWALRALDAAGLRRPPVRLLLSGDEEIGSPASRPVIEAEAASSAATLVFEAAADGAVKTARKGVGIFEIEVIGVEAHAGLDPDSGVSAVDELARAVLTLHSLADPQAGTTVNVGVIEGGTRSNVTAGRAWGHIDVRVADRTEADRIDAALAALAPHDPRATLTVRGEWNRPVMERGPGTAELYALARRLADDLGFQLGERSVGGASDGNFVAGLGLPVLDGLGAVGDGAHARHEHISLTGLTERTTLTATLLNALAG
jgi:glutamate carboxypeptidase